MCGTQFTRRVLLRALIAAAAVTALMDQASAGDNVYPNLVRSTAWVVTPAGTGTAVVVDREQRILATNFHVVGLHSEVRVVFPDRVNTGIVAERKHYVGNLDRLAVKGAVIRRDPRRDLALV